MRRWAAPRGLWLVVWSISGLMATATWAAEPSAAVPETASVVLRIKAPQAALNKLGDFVDAVQPGVGAVVKGNLAALGLAISNPTLAGVDTNKDWWAVVSVERQQKPKVVFMIPATDVGTLKNSIPSGWSSSASDNLLVYSEDEQAQKQISSRLSETSSTGLWSKLDATTKKQFDASDLSVLIHLGQLKKTFASELDQAEPQLDGFLNQISSAIPDAQRNQIVPMLDVYRVLGKSALQGVRDSESLTIGLSFSKDAIRLENRLRVADGTATAKFFAAQPTSELSLLSQLPGKKLGYFALKADMGGMVDWSMNMTKAWMTNSSEDQKAKFEAALKEMRSLKWNEIAAYFDLDPNGAGAIRAGSVSDVSPANKVRDISRSMLKAMGEIQSLGFKQTTTLETAAEKIGSVEVDRITIKQEFDPALDPIGMQRKIQTLLFGENGMQQLVMYQPTRSLQTFGGGLDELKNLASALDSKTAKDAAVTAARKRFPEKANLVGLVDLARLAVNGIKLAAREGAIPINAAALDGLQLEPSFIGVSVACESNAAGAQLEIPVEQAQGIARIVMLMMQRGQ